MRGTPASSLPIGTRRPEYACPLVASAASMVAHRRLCRRLAGVAAAVSWSVRSRHRPERALPAASFDLPLNRRPTSARFRMSRLPPTVASSSTKGRSKASPGCFYTPRHTGVAAPARYRGRALAVCIARWRMDWLLSRWQDLQGVDERRRSGGDLRSTGWARRDMDRPAIESYSREPGSRVFQSCRRMPGSPPSSPHRNAHGRRLAIGGPRPSRTDASSSL